MRIRRSLCIVFAALLVPVSVISFADGAKRELSDADINFAVESELLLDEAVPAHKIDVSTANGIVTLDGTVPTYSAKRMAEYAAESVKGVTAVANHITVVPASRLDSRVKDDIVAKLAADPVTDAFEIDVAVDNGVVTLAGEVNSYAEREVAEQVAAEVSGVIGVHNNLTYKLSRDRVDSDIRADVEYYLRSDASIDASRISVLVDDGTVTLKGNVGSAAEKREAEEEALMVPGAESVDNRLEVKWWLADQSDDWDDGWTDADMERAIKESLAIDPRVSAFDIVVDVFDGIASLSGTVENLQAKRAAETRAADTLGVWYVRNNIRVRPEEEPTDADMAKDIRQSLQEDPYVDRYEIAVQVYDGQAYLYGNVDSAFMKRRAELLASAVPGVFSVRNRLAVDESLAKKSDEEIHKDIEQQLFWSPFVDSDDITVSVNSGVATLFGTVDDWGEAQVARENAREGGATSVISKLKIRNGFGS